jgi:exo-beta-1,3-glucanase (GH17 family)
LGIKVMLKPHLDIEDGTYRGDFYPTDGWFENYKKFIKHYARMAQEYNVEMYCVGVELRGATTWEKEDQWRDLIKEVRSLYKGPLTYSANWDEFDKVNFWDALDYIGIDAYFPLTDKNDAALPELVRAWQDQADKLEEWYKKNGHKQPILFTELGYPSVDGANVQPWVGLTKTPDRQEQADCIQAAFEALTKRSWFRGFYWWHYFPVERPVVDDLTLRGKPAEQVVSQWYKKIIQDEISQGGNLQ